MPALVGEVNPRTDRHISVRDSLLLHFSVRPAITSTIQAFVCSDAIEQCTAIMSAEFGAGLIRPPLAIKVGHLWTSAPIPLCIRLLHFGDVVFGKMARLGVRERG